jgi:hypothetical protein
MRELIVPNPPNPNVAPAAYIPQYHNQINNQLKLYLNTLSANQLEIVKFINELTNLNLLSKNNFDAFGRLRVSQPLTIFDSQNRYAKDPQFDEALTGSGASTFLSDEAAVKLEVTAASGDKVVRQSKRVMPYQPGKSLLVLATFAMAEGEEDLRQRVGYFNADNGVYFEQNGTELAFVIRTSTSGSVSDARRITQANWNTDKMDGTTGSAITLDPTKTQILFMDFEWLGVGSVRCGFVIDGVFVTAHVFHNANSLGAVYMQTATLPVRYEIETTGAISGVKSMKQICSSVMSEGGYNQTAPESVARRTAALTSISTTFLPLVSIRLASDSLGSVVIPSTIRVLPTSNGDYEVALIKNGSLTSASYDTTTFPHVDFDVSATAISGGTIVKSEYATASPLSASEANVEAGYNFDLQLGVTIGGTSDVYTLAVRTISSTGAAVGSLAFYDLTA